MAFTLALTGLDGTNPLGFLAALGALRLADAAAPGAASLDWQPVQGWTARLHLGDPTVLPSPDIAGLAAALLPALRRRGESPTVRGLHWQESNDKGVQVTKRNLRARPDVWQAWALALRSAASADRLDLDFVAATAAERERDNNGKLVPTVLEFTSGQQMFLKLAEDLLSEVTAEDLTRALAGPWSRARELPVLGYDAADARDYALRATNPSGDKKTGEPGADALALWGLACLPVFPGRTKNRTTAAGGVWKSQWLRWGLWAGPVGVDVLRTLLPWMAQEGLRAEDAARRGVVTLLAADIGRSEQGGYGSFSPSRPRG